MTRLNKNCLLLCCFIYFTSVVSSEFRNALKGQDDKCNCELQEEQFDHPISDKVKNSCRKCYTFTYNFEHNQTWASELCIKSKNASPQFPMFIVIRETFNIMSFQVPLIFPGVRPYSEICRTLCPLPNYDDMNKKISGSQNISVEVTSSSEVWLDFEFTLLNVTDFIIENENPRNVTLTPSKPRVLQYHIQRDLPAVRIEAHSQENSCMIMAIQNVQCPIYDSVESVDNAAYFQTLTRQSGISVMRNTFKYGKLYVVLLLKPTDVSCLEPNELIPFVLDNRVKEVTLQVIPSITDSEFYSAVVGAFAVYVCIWIFSLIITLLFSRRKHNHETEIIDIESPTIQNYGTSDSESPSDVNSHSLSPAVSFDETDMDKLPDADIDKNVVRTKTVLYVSDLSKKKDNYLSKKSKVYSWNLLTIAIFYGLPVVQLVYINQGTVNQTGNQDLCYYNFLCSHQLWMFSDFNHIYSNLGYIMLGLLFLLLVWRREYGDLAFSQARARKDKSELCGIPRHFGLLYSMGWALFMEGVLSASYHVCPSRANFQFDTAFMFVIATVCIIKLYQSRHPDITVQSHTTWMVLAMVIIICFGGLIKGGIFVWVLFVLCHMFVTLVVSAKIYYMGRFKCDRWLLKRMLHNIKVDIGSRSARPTYFGRFLMLSVAVLVNLSLDIYGLAKQPFNFGAYLLSIFIVNLLMYLIYYSFMKIRYKEKIRWIPLMFMLLSFICWGFALHFFLAKNTSWQVTPAESRQRNKHCIILNFFDHHDIWHFLSSCALFFSFMVLLTLDDDLENIPRSKIIVF